MSSSHVTHSPHSPTPQLVAFDTEPFYLPIADEVDVFAAAAKSNLAVMVKGPTGCGKTRFVQHMAWRLKRPLITVVCHDNLSSADLLGRYLIAGDETVWIDGPLTAAVRAGAICYLDEWIEARQGATVVAHPLTDSRRALPLDRRGEYVEAEPDFMLAISYNPTRQSMPEEIKPSTRQHFVALEFGYPDAAIEARIVAHEGGVDYQTAKKLDKLGELTRQMKGAGLDEGAGTRLLVHAATLIKRGVEAKIKC